jgi:hypothetical protein
MAAAGLLAAAPLFALAQDKAGLTYRCLGKDGKKYYGSTIPQPCYGQKMELINAQGNVVKRIDPDAAEQDKAQKAAAALANKKPEQTPAEREADRRKRALLATYNNEKDIEDARARALRENQNQVSQVEAKINELKTRRARYEKELAIYTEKAKTDKNVTPPQVLKDNITNADMDIKANEGVLAARRKEAERINAKYDEDRKYFHEITAR